jgi:hypothetical protein
MSRVIPFRLTAAGQFGGRPQETYAPGVTPGAPAICTEAVYVVYTTVEETFAAIRIADDFARTLGVPITVVHFRTVPYVLPLERPNGISPIETEEFVERLRAEGLNANLHVYLGRDEQRTMPSVFEPHSLIVLGGRPSWLPTRSERTRRMLEAAGHFVMFVDAPKPSIGRRAARNGRSAAVAKERFYA